MTDSFALGAASALWLGILTSISPCPLATNIAAISYIGKDLGAPRLVLATGVAYTFGRMLTYLILAALLVASMLSIPHLAQFLQAYMNKLLGPILIVVGMFLLNLLEFNFSTTAPGATLEAKFQSWGVWGGGLLGMLFALSFCPVSAALFFGSLIPLAVKSQSSVVLPALYGVGTGLPVLVFAILIAIAARSVEQAFERLTKLEKWARIATGIVLIGVGIYLSLVHIFDVFS